MTKHYRVKKDTFLWKEGAILKHQGENTDGYRAIEDVWDVTPVNDSEYISSQIIEHSDSKDFFERVYPDIVTGKVFITKDQIVEAYKTVFAA